ncbi:hypothetical protein EDE15_3910 [Edaphobacter aggregans]|uniref:Uncharacterized protein n=1 Tax=Edaphobacter aggregans TaxID=570835 RepID=A0A428MN52_9BACT|nr:hypothetical protein EDE15_3910 [Edaphobacter aggregans]
MGKRTLFALWPSIRDSLWIIHDQPKAGIAAKRIADLTNPVRRRDSLPSP